MASIWRPLDIQTYKSWVEAILFEASDDLSEWEEGFMESIDRRLREDRNLTQGQAGTLEKIYAEKTK